MATRCAEGQGAAQPWSDVRLTQQELAIAPDPHARATTAQWGKPDRPATGQATDGIDDGAHSQGVTQLAAQPHHVAEQGAPSDILPWVVEGAPPQREGAPAPMPSTAQGERSSPAGERAEPTLPAAEPPEPQPTHAVPNPMSNPELDDEEVEPSPPRITIRPPVLASDALRRELFPLEPGRSLVRAVAGLLGFCGLAGTILLLGLSPSGVPISSGFLAMTILGVVPMAYLARAAALALFSALGLFAANLISLHRAMNLDSLGLLLSVVLLGLGLHFRAWHRASKTARALVALGILMGSVWILRCSSLPELTVLQGSWRGWAPMVAEVPFSLLLLLSLLGFMDARTTGGCGAWAFALWAWYATYLCIHVAAKVWPTEAPYHWEFANELGTGSVALLANGLLAPLLALATAQLLAGAFAVLKTARHESQLARSLTPPALTGSRRVVTATHADPQ